jgi:hypothetical protein
MSLRILTGVLIGLWLMFFALTMIAAPARASEAAYWTEAHDGYVEHLACYEDDPCWNWATMGDRKRGVVTMWGTPKIVTCGGLRWLVRHGDLDPHTPWLRGDYSCGRRRAG